MHPIPGFFPRARSGSPITRQNTFRNLAWGFTGATFAAAVVFYMSKKYVEGRRRADLEIYDAVVAQQRLDANTKP
ncbi:hypothetical protein D9757_013083 [Collybiopsis confluens]|uniref:Uncharacterized protein n=1 Tax=Collybiopsis confluens TaxID=2823264 RepID=A0A8H5CZ08_9AGAR|nr:hypothetical protein D9757_013083 [Collybiopsis confluens]